MALFCTCGAALPDHARFCHSCGKPQREEDLPAAAPIPLPPAPEPPAGTPPINFSNPIAVRVAVLCGSLSALLNVLPFISLGCCLWITGAGFLSVVLYSRRTGLHLSTGEGARMGWLTGLLTFVISLVLTSVNIVLARSAGGFREMVRRSLERMPAQDEVARQFAEFLTSPAGLAIFLMSYVVLGLVMVVSLAVAGGAMGAKVLEKD